MKKFNLILLLTVLVNACNQKSNIMEPNKIDDFLTSQVNSNKTPSVQYLFFDSKKIIHQFNYGYADIKDYPNAKTYYLKAVKLAIELDMKKHQAELLSKLGKVHLTSKKLKDAFKCFEESLNIAQELKDKQQETDLFIKEIGFMKIDLMIIKIRKLI